MIRFIHILLRNGILGEKNRETCALKILKKSDIEREEKDKVIHLEEYDARSNAIKPVVRSFVR